MQSMVSYLPSDELILAMDGDEETAFDSLCVHDRVLTYSIQMLYQGLDMPVGIISLPLHPYLLLWPPNT